MVFGVKDKILYYHRGGMNINVVGRVKGAKGILTLDNVLVI